MDGISLELMRPRLMEHSPEVKGGERSFLPQQPALFAAYGELGTLRHDFPIILTENEAGNAPVQPLTAIFDEAIRNAVPEGPGGEWLRWQLLHLEARIRGAVSNGARDTFLRLWRRVEHEILSICDADRRKELVGHLDRIRESLNVDGELIDCDADTPVRILVHCWNTTHARKAKAFRKRVDGLILKLSDILKADFVKSDKANSPEILKASVGDTFETDFDFEAMSRVLVEGTHHDMLSPERRRRIEAVLTVLRSQRFYGPGRASGRWVGDAEPYVFIFDNCADAIDAFRDRLPQMVDFIEALSIAELEIRNKYRPELHDSFFARFDDCDLTEADLAMFPSYLVCLRDGQSDAAETVRALEAIASGFSVKVLIQTDDILGDSSPEPPRTSFGGGSARLAAMALGVHNAYVFQAPSSAICRLQERVLNGLNYDGPALFSIYSGATQTVEGIPPYLLAAAAMESRAFPTFTYDPSAGPNLATRFDITDNPQLDSDWPIHTLAFEDEAQQRINECVAFTHVDFALCDSRYIRHWMPTSHGKWTESMMPTADYLGLKAPNGSEVAPYIWTTDANGRIRRTIVDDRMLDAARRCKETWRSLQELGGINNSHALLKVAISREEWRQELETEQKPHTAQESQPIIGPAQATAAVEPAPPSVAEVDLPEPEAPLPDDPWIETSRCTTCNECTEINNKVFKYNEDKQAYIADANAGTYRQMVEAAESCQVSIIHPGKPRNLNEPNLDELMERAALFD